MPDLLTHIAVAYGCQRCAMKSPLTSWFLVGTVLPDVLTRPFSILFPSLAWFVMPLHTPVGLLLVCALVSHLIPQKNRRSVFYNLLGGAALHLLLDLFQKHIGGGYYMFFPFSWWSFEFGFIWPETSLYLLPLWIGAAFLLGFRAAFRMGEPKKVMSNALFNQRSRAPWEEIKR